MVLVFSHMGQKPSTPNMKDSLWIHNLKEKGNCGGRMEKCLRECSRMDFQFLGFIVFCEF